MKKILILGNMDNEKLFRDAERKLAEDKENIVINPVKIMYALPEGINKSDFIVVLIELVRISDAVVLMPDWKIDLAATIANTNARRGEKEIIEWTEI